MSHDDTVWSRRSFITISTAVAAHVAGFSGAAKAARSHASDPSEENIDLTDATHCSGPIQRREEHKVIVVGTGFGGGVAALRLGQAGIQTLVLERGREWPITSGHNTFSSFKRPDSRCRWLGNRPALPLAPFRFFKKTTGILERIKGPDIDVVVGAGVGGGSLSFGGVMAQPPKEFFESVFPPEIPYEEMDNIYYPRVKKEMGFSPMPDDIYNSKNYKVARMFESHAQDAGFTPTRLEAVYDWDVVRKEISGELPSSTSVGQYMYGVSSGAKLSLDRNYIKRAKETGHVELRTHHAVQKIGQTSTGYYLEVARIDESGKIKERILMTCDKLIMAAGSMWTSKLLLTAKETGRLSGMNEHIGQHWGNNGERVFLRSLLPESTLTTQGGPPSVGTMFAQTAHGPMSIEVATTAMPFETNTMCVAALGIPEGHGHFKYNPRSGKVVLNFPHSAYMDSVKRMAKVLKEWNRSSGGILVDFDKMTGAVSYHPLGGAVLGKACDYYGRVHGRPGLYVVDSSLIAGSTACANPAWTVAALAERCMEHILVKDFAVL